VLAGAILSQSVFMTSIDPPRAGGGRAVTPLVTLIMLAGLESVPESALEAAAVDGAGAWRRFWYVTLPLLRPSLITAVVLRATDAFRIFEFPLILTGKSVPALGTFAYSEYYGYYNPFTSVSALGWPSFRSDAYGTIESWQTPYFVAVQEALRLAHPKPHVPNWAEVGRALSGAFREIVYEGQPVQAALDRYHHQLQQDQK
jgi:Binding-protein-dependent transport system inner membrane component